MPATYSWSCSGYAVHSVCRTLQRRMHSGTVSPRISCRMAPICGRYRSCSDMRACRPPRSTPKSTGDICWSNIKRHIRGQKPVCRPQHRVHRVRFNRQHPAKQRLVNPFGTKPGPGPSVGRTHLAPFLPKHPLLVHKQGLAHRLILSRYIHRNHPARPGIEPDQPQRNGWPLHHQLREPSRSPKTPRQLH